MFNQKFSKMKTKKFEIGNLMTKKGKVIELGDEFECVLNSSVWYHTKTTGSLFRKNESPSGDVDWFALPQNVEITARGGTYGNEMFDCVAEIL